MKINKSLQKAQYFAHYYYKNVDKYFKYIGNGANAFIVKQEKGQKEADKILVICNEHDKLVYDLLNIGWSHASQLIIMWIDGIVEDQLDGFGFYWLWSDIDECKHKILKPMLESLGKSIKKHGLYEFILNHPKLNEKHLWQKYIYGKTNLEVRTIDDKGNKTYSIKYKN